MSVDRPSPVPPPNQPPSRHLSIWRRTGLGWRVFFGLLVVVAVEAGVFGLVAWFVSDSQFAVHLRMVGVADPEVVKHAQEAYLTSVAIALGASLIVAILGGGLAAWFIARQIGRPLAKFSQVAEAVVSGDYSARVERSAIGPEFDRVEAAFNEMTERLQDTEEARAQLIADLSHEMRTPLMTLTVYLEALEDGVRPPLATTWEVMSDQVRRLSRLTKDMSLASANQEAAMQVDKQDADLTKIVELVVRSWRAGPLGSRLIITGHVPPRPVVVPCDAARIEQVLANLIDNAGRHAQHARRVDVTLTQDPEWVTITVADDGDGIALEDRSRVFDRFFRANRSRTGTGSGLGLAISRAIMIAHGGRLSLDESEGRGTTFVMTLPAS